MYSQFSLRIVSVIVCVVVASFSRDVNIGVCMLRAIVCRGAIRSSRPRGEGVLIYRYISKRNEVVACAACAQEVVV